MSAPDLLAAFGNTPADLEANRAGRLGAAQARRLRRGTWTELGAALIVGILLALILAFVANRPLKPAQWITALVLFLAVAAVAVHHGRGLRRAVAEGRVERLTGPVTVESRGREGWWLLAQGREFRLPVRPWHLTSGAAYHVYHAPAAGRVVAMEPA